MEYKFIRLGNSNVKNETVINNLAKEGWILKEVFALPDVSNGVISPNIQVVQAILYKDSKKNENKITSRVILEDNSYDQKY